MFNTSVFTALGSLIRSLWSEPVGQVFVVTVTTYLICYVIYSGYLSWFYGGYGASLLSQIGFTAIDFLGLIPTTFLLIVKLFLSLLKFVARYFAYYIFFPSFVFIVLVGEMGHYNFHVFPNNLFLAQLGVFSWMIGLALGLSSTRENKLYYRISIALCYIGVVFLLASTPFTSNSPINPSTSSILEVITRTLLELMSVMLIILAVVYLFFIGASLASLSVREKMLSKVEKIVLTKDLQLVAEIPAKKRKSTKPKLAPQETYSFEITEDKPVYLAGSFNKTIALYFPAETTGSERGKLVVISNDIICSLEITGSKMPIDE